ncbi:MAG: hypothetical protein ABI165_00320, partial [Bryobacteraceae bacterium]
TTVTLDDDVYEAAAHVAHVSGKRLGQVLSILVRRGLAPAKSPKRTQNSRRFPVFEVTPGSPIIPASRVQRVIDEDGLF